MADTNKKSPEELQEEINALQAKLETSEAEKAEMRAAMDQGKFLGEEIDGTFKAKIKNVQTNKTVTKEFGFARGHRYLFIDGKKMLTTAVMQLANGKDIEEEVLKANPQLKGLTILLPWQKSFGEGIPDYSMKERKCRIS